MPGSSLQVELRPGHRGQWRSRKRLSLRRPCRSIHQGVLVRGGRAKDKERNPDVGMMGQEVLDVHVHLLALVGGGRGPRRVEGEIRLRSGKVASRLRSQRKPQPRRSRIPAAGSEGLMSLSTLPKEIKGRAVLVAGTRAWGAKRVADPSSVASESLSGGGPQADTAEDTRKTGRGGVRLGLLAVGPRVDGRPRTAGSRAHLQVLVATTAGAGAGILGALGEGFSMKTTM